MTTKVFRGRTVVWKAVNWFQPCVYCEIPTQCRNRAELPAHEECEWDALLAERFTVGGRSR